ncbi:MAG: hypothetical protein U0136_01375 [Bdellovibrionota bacterium]
MAGFNDLLQILVSFFVEAGGQGVSRGGKGIVLSGLRKIGWAKGGGGGGGRMRSHRLGGHRMGSGVGGARNLANYNPKNDLKARMAADANRGRRSGSGAKEYKPGGAPAHLHGRSSFTAANTLSGNSGSRWVRGKQTRGNGAPHPRGFIKFK